MKVWVIVDKKGKPWLSADIIWVNKTKAKAKSAMEWNTVNRRAEGLSIKRMILKDTTHE